MPERLRNPVHHAEVSGSLTRALLGSFHSEPRQLAEPQEISHQDPEGVLECGKAGARGSLQQHLGSRPGIPIWAIQHAALYTTARFWPAIRFLARL